MLRSSTGEREQTLSNRVPSCRAEHTAGLGEHSPGPHAASLVVLDSRVFEQGEVPHEPLRQLHRHGIWGRRPVEQLLERFLLFSPLKPDVVRCELAEECDAVWTLDRVLEVRQLLGGWLGRDRDQLADALPVFQQAPRTVGRPRGEAAGEYVMLTGWVLQQCNMQPFPDGEVWAVGQCVPLGLRPQPEAQVLHDDIRVAISDEQDDVLAEHPLKEPRSPRTVEVRMAEVAVGHDQTTGSSSADPCRYTRPSKSSPSGIAGARKTSNGPQWCARSAVSRCKS